MYAKNTEIRFLPALLLCLMFCLVNLPVSMAAETESELNFRWILPPEFYRGNDFHNNRAWVQREQGGPWTLFDSEGNVIKDGFLARHVAQDELRDTRFVPLGADRELEWAMAGIVCDYSGDVLFEPTTYIHARLFQDGIAGKRGENGLWGFVDFEGEWFISPIYEGFSSVEDDFISVRKDGMRGIINRNGEVVIDFRFEDIRVLGGGLFVAQYGSLYGLVDLNGNWITEAVFDWFMHPQSSSQPIGARKNGLVGFLDANGNVAIDFRFACFAEIVTIELPGPPQLANWGIQRTGFSTFNGGAAAVLLPAEGDLPVRWAVINESGDIISTEQYTSILPFRDGLAIAVRDNSRFFLDTEGKEHPFPSELEGAAITRSDDSRIFRAHFKDEGRTGYFKMRE